MTKQLNSSELQIMEYLWKLEKAFLKDIVELYPEPKPAYTTISTVLSRMCKKEYVGFEKLGRDKHYFPILQKNHYFGNQIRGMISNFFNNSKTQFASFFTKTADLSVEELRELQTLLAEQIENKKSEKK
jgi:predicted transcriptional regulator